jgi:nitroreductase
MAKSSCSSELIKSLHWRYATKRFDPKLKIPADLWRTLEEALVLTPSSFGLQPWKFLVVTDPAVKVRLRAASWGQPQIEECSHLVVYTARQSMQIEDIKRFLERIAEVRGVSVESLSDYRDMMAGSLIQGPLAQVVEQWTAKQVYLALGNFLTCAAILGVDACPMEGLDPGKYDQILGLEGTGYHSLVVSAAGYRAQDDAYATLAKVRFPLEQVIQRI